MMKKSILMRIVFFASCLFILSTTTYAQWPQPQNVNMRSEAAWPRNSYGTTTINVCWENPEGYETGTRWVRDAVEKTWHAEADLQFTGWGEKCSSNSRGIRILIKDEAAAPHTKGLGTDLDGVYGGMVLNFTFRNFRCSLSNESCTKFIAVHEFGHALGIAHEHNRKDCLCEEKPQGKDGSLYVTSCDMNSVMNYCNKRWNNYGVLSEGDKKGIRIIYGEKRKWQFPDWAFKQPSPRVENAQTLVSIKDDLYTGQTSDTGSVDQLWENIYVEIRGVGQFIHVDKSNPTQTRTLNFGSIGTGSYRYRVWSYTIENEYFRGQFVQQAVRLGYGEGELYLTKGKSHTFTVFVREQPYSWNPAGYMNLTLK